MNVIDCHCHIYPEKIAGRAVQSVGDFYLIHMDESEGTGEGLLAACAGSPITHYVVHSVAVKPSNVQHINDYIASQCEKHPEFIGFATLHQDFEDPEAEIERAMSMGLRGLKLHPDTQQVNMDDPRLMRIYEIIEGRLPLIVHTGDYRYDYSHPRRLRNILKAFPNLVVDAAHYGGWSIPEQGYDYLHDANESLFIDVSSSMQFLGPRRSRELINMWGTERVLFGSDFPMWSPVAEYDAFMGLGFSDAAYENMLWHNCERFLGFEVK